MRYVVERVDVPGERHVPFTSLRYAMKPLHGSLLDAARGAAKRLLGRRGRRVARLLVSREARDDARSAWHRQRTGVPALPAGGVRKVLVICRGNLCRSPFASALLASLRPELAVHPAGLDAREGDGADAMALRTATAYAVDLRGHATRAPEAGDVRWADLILAMEGHQTARITRRWPEARGKTRELGHFPAEPPYAIEDPWGQGEDVFERCFERIESALRRLCEQLDGGQQLDTGAVR